MARSGGSAKAGAIALGASATALVASVGLILSGVAAGTTGGTALPSAPVRAYNTLTDATSAFVSAPAVRYKGTVTTGGTTVRLDDVAVSTDGTVLGTVNLDGGSARVAQVAGSAFVNGDSTFWRKRQEVAKRDGSGSTTSDMTKVAGQWVAAPLELFGFDLSKTLTPSRFGTVSGNDEARYRDQPLTSGTVVPRSSETPDRRIHPSQDPPNISVADNGLIDSGGTQSGIGDQGQLIGVFGAFSSSTPAERTPSGKLSVTVMSKDETTSFFSTIETLSKDLQRVPAPEVVVPKPQGKLDCGDVVCVLRHTFSNTMPGADRGEVTVNQTSNVTLNGAPIGSCARTIRMAMNSWASSECSIPYVPPRNVQMNFNAQSGFEIIGTAYKDVQVIVKSVDTGRKLADSKGNWKPTAPKAQPAARAYNQQIAGVPSGYAFVVGDFPFDGRESDGTLLMVNGAGYDAHVLPNGTFDPRWAGTRQLVDNARAARAAAGDQPVRMVFAESRSAGAMQKLLTTNGISGIQVIPVPAAG